MQPAERDQIHPQAQCGHNECRNRQHLRWCDQPFVSFEQDPDHQPEQGQTVYESRQHLPAVVAVAEPLIHLSI